MHRAVQCATTLRDSSRARLSDEVNLLGPPVIRVCTARLRIIVGRMVSDEDARRSSMVVCSSVTLSTLRLGVSRSVDWPHNSCHSTPSVGVVGQPARSMQQCSTSTTQGIRPSGTCRIGRSCGVQIPFCILEQTRSLNSSGCQHVEHRRTHP